MGRFSIICLMCLGLWAGCGRDRPEIKTVEELELVRIRVPRELAPGIEAAMVERLERTPGILSLLFSSRQGVVEMTLDPETLPREELLEVFAGMGIRAELISEHPARPDGGG